MSLRILTTGGTFDKHYDPVTGTLGFTESHLPEIVRRARLGDDIAIEVVMLIDSLDMVEAHRQTALERCRAAPESALVVVHGTDTMPETARLLGPAKLAKTIVLTGAMVPYEMDGSDALFNLGFACGCARSLPHGVYVAMHGRVFAWDKVRKNRAAGVFEES